MAAPAPAGDTAEATTAILPERGLVFSEIKPLQLQLCKPKLLPIKSYSLERLEKMEKKIAQDAKEKRGQDRAQRQAAVGWTSPDLLAPAPVPKPAVPKAPVLAGRSDSNASPAPTAPATMLQTGAQVPALPAAASATAGGTPSSSRLTVASPETLSSPPAHTDEDAGADAPMSAPERSSPLSSGTAVSSSSSSSAVRSSSPGAYSP